MTKHTLKLAHSGKYYALALSLLIATYMPLFAAQTQSGANRAQMTLSSPSWATVLSGNPMCAPVRNSFGYVTVAEGRMLCAFTQSGDIIWQRGITAKPKPLISIGPADMIYLVSREGDLNMLNPGGMILWTSKAGFPITEAPLPGRDGRIFVRGEKYIACYGLKGVRRWKTQIESSDTKIPLTELNDGSLLVFSKKTSEGKSIAFTISPFGEVGKEVVFAGKVESVASVSHGVLVSFSDGGIGLCAEKNGELYSRWAIKSGQEGISSPTTVLSEGFSVGRAAVLTGSPATVIIINTANGETISSFETPYTIQSLMYKGRTAQGLVLASTSQATCYSTEGNTVWSANFNPQKKWNFVFPTDAGYLAFFTKDWIVEGYRVRQSLSSAESSTFKAKSVRQYPLSKATVPSSYLSGPAIGPVQAQKIKEAFEKGDFGAEEKDWTPLLNNEMYDLLQAWQQSYTGAIGEQPYLRTNADYIETLLDLAASCGTAAYQGNFANLLRHTNDISMKMRIIKNAGKMAFDANGSMLSEFENLLRKTDTKGNDMLFMAICDSTFEICRFMGRPAFFARGKDILVAMIAPQYPESVREYARSVLNKFVEIKL